MYLVDTNVLSEMRKIGSGKRTQRWKRGLTVRACGCFMSLPSRYWS